MCIFCKIADKQIPARVVFEEEDLIAFHDVNPVAPTHILVIPKQHLVSLNEVTAADQSLLGKLFLAASRAAQEVGLRDSGYRVVVNNGAHAGQSVFHIHLHVLGGRAMTWPPG